MQTYDAVPESIRQGHRFCVWKWAQGSDGRPTKVPYDPRRQGRKARTNDPETFASFDVALEAYRSGGYAGLGIRIDGALVGVDVDHCLNPEGIPNALATAVVSRLDGYTEVSPSGDGIHVLVEAPAFVDGMDPETYKARYMFKSSPRAEGLEVYVAGMTSRFLTLTGDAFGAYGTTDGEDRTTELRGILDDYMAKEAAGPQIAPQPVDVDDMELLARARMARNGAAFSRLWDGDASAYSSRSEADLALCNALAFWTGRDADRIDRLFRASGLMREKWERDDYRVATIARAVEGCTETYRPRATAQEPPRAPRKAAGEALDEFLELVQTEAYKPFKTGDDAIDTLLCGGITRQSLVVVQGGPGTGKTALVAGLFAAIADQGQDCIYLNLEMSREYMVARDLSRVAFRQFGHVVTATQVLRGYAWDNDTRYMVQSAAASYRERIAPHLLYNPDECGPTLEEIEALLARYGSEAKAAGKMAPPVALDYLHLVTSASGMDAGEIVKRTVAMLKAYAIKYDTFAVAIAATNRASNSAGRQTQSSARDSSAIEYTADVQLAVNFAAFVDGWKKPTEKGERRYDPENTADMDELLQAKPRKMVLQVLKNRMDMPGGKLYMDFHAGQSLYKKGKKAR